MRRADSFFPTLIGFSFVFLLTFLLYLTPAPVKKIVDFLDRNTYDWRVSHYHQRLPVDPPIVIIDIDDNSLAKVGRWPWARSVMGNLTAKVFEAGAKCVAFDVMFPEHNQEDQEFAEALQKGTAILGFALKDSDETIGQLPFSLLLIEDGVGFQIAEKTGYISNVPILEKAAKTAGFLNSFPDPDGVLRRSPLLIRRGNDVYGSLGFMAAFFYLNTPPIQIKSGNYRGREVMEGIVIGTRSVPTDPAGKVLIPFRGLPYTFPYVSAIDVLEGKIDRKQFEQKLVFIGTSATSLGDLNPTAIFPVFSGVEIHASIAQGILDGYFPYQPAWGLGADAIFLFVFGGISAFFFPRANLPIRILLVMGLPSILLFFNEIFWSKFSLVLSMAFPIASIGILFLMNLIWGYFFESKKRHEIRALFGQYIPSDRIDQILLGAHDIGLEGESRELTVLFADIRGFTAIAEKMEAPEVKTLLTDFFTPMTEIIFKNKGTIDKYVGDLVMAFWGAPLEDKNHAIHAVKAAIEMQIRLDELDAEWKEMGKPIIHIGIGINTGIMSVGDMGSRFRKAYTVLGDSVNLASRLESLSKYYGAKIVVGENTFFQTKDQIGYRKLDKVKVVGKTSTTEIYEPIGFIGALKENEQKKIDDTNAFLNAYFSKNWSLAKKLLEPFEKTDPIWANLFFKRIESHLKNPPPDQWDGAFILDMK